MLIISADTPSSREELQDGRERLLPTGGTISLAIRLISKEVYRVIREDGGSR
jgi:hypothetical protein